MATKKGPSAAAQMRAQARNYQPPKPKSTTGGGGRSVGRVGYPGHAAVIFFYFI